MREGRWNPKNGDLDADLYWKVSEILLKTFGIIYSILRPDDNNNQIVFVKLVCVIW